jgi:hypothetical protein
MADNTLDSILLLLSGPPNATALRDYDPPCHTQGLLPILRAQPLWVLDPVGTWWEVFNEARDYGRVRYTFIAPLWTEPRPRYVPHFLWCKSFPLGDLVYILHSSLAPGGFPRLLYALSDILPAYSRPSFIEVLRGDPVFVAREDIASSARVYIACNVQGLVGHVPCEALVDQLYVAHIALPL